MDIPVAMYSLKIALLQLLPGRTQQEALQKGLAACRTAKQMGADVALFPELWNTGYSIPQDMAALRTAAVSPDSPFVRAFAGLAAELGMAIAVSFLEAYEPSPRNTVCLFDRFGQRVLTYAKVHTCDFGDERVLTPGGEFPVASLDTENGAVNIGAMICYDREFPESARILMLNGAEILLIPNACPMEINRISQLRARAYENMIGIATANYPKGQPDCNGHSTAFDGIAYAPEEACSRDTLILEAGEREGIYIADFPIEEIRAYRRREVHGNAYRHPQTYAKLVSTEIREPFVRPDYRK